MHNFVTWYVVEFVCSTVRAAVDKTHCHPIVAKLSSSCEMPPLDTVVVLPGELQLVFYRCTRCQGAFATPGHINKPICSSSGRFPRNYRHASLLETVGVSVGTALQQRGINTLQQWAGLSATDAEQELQSIVYFVASQVQQLQRTAGVRLSAGDPCKYLEAAVREVLQLGSTGQDKFAVFRGVPMSAGRSSEYTSAHLHSA